MSLLELCEWIQFSSPLVALRSSTWFFPVVATIHLMGLAVIGGAVLVKGRAPRALGRVRRSQQQDLTYQ